LGRRDRGVRGNRVHALNGSVRREFLVVRQNKDSDNFVPRKFRESSLNLDFVGVPASVVVQEFPRRRERESNEIRMSFDRFLPKRRK
jgi:hypothetical protein